MVVLVERHLCHTFCFSRIIGKSDNTALRWSTEALVDWSRMKKSIVVPLRTLIARSRRRSAMMTLLRRRALGEARCELENDIELPLLEHHL